MKWFDIGGEGEETDGLNQKGVELLCAYVLQYAYKDLLDALFAATALAHKDDSYNCHVYAEWLRTGRGKYSYSKGGMEIAEGEVRKMEYWFRSEKCKQFCMAVAGEWFIEQAHSHVEEWARDEIPEWEARPSYETNEEKNTTNRKREKRSRDAWQANRDAWRKENGKEEIK